MSQKEHTQKESPKTFISRILPHLIIVGVFLVIAAIFCAPWLQGHRLLPHDVEQWLRMSKESRDYTAATGNLTFWANNNFAGMPNAMTDPISENNWMNKLRNIGLFYKHGEVVNPIWLFLWAMMGAYLLGKTLRFKNWIAAIAGIAFAFSTYNPIIIAAGHTTKMMDIAYFPGILAGIVIAYRGKYWLGSAIAGVFVAFSLDAGHYQIIYYSIFAVLALIINEFIKALKAGQLKRFFIASALLATGAALAAGTAASRLLMTQEVSEYTTRGNNKELKGSEDDGKGLDKDYAFKWSNGIEETFALFVPNLYGGGNLMKVDENNSITQQLRIPSQSVAGISYWGPQQSDGLGGSVYFGAIVMFLMILSLLVVQSKDKWWLFIVGVFFIMVSWGKNFAGLNYFLFDTLPGMNKFRSPNMALAISSLMFPILAAWAINDIVTGKVNKDELLKKFKLGVGITGGILVIILIACYTMMDFVGAMDATIFDKNWNQVASTIIDYRRGLAVGDTFRSIAFFALAAAVIWMFIKEKLSGKVATIALFALVTLDLAPVAYRYLGSEKYLDEFTYKNHFAPRPVDQEIMKDKSYYRVVDFTSDLFNSSTASYFHKTIGGYHPAKLQIYQDLIAHQIGKLNISVINMLNGKYFINAGANGKPTIIPNPEALGNAWFVNEVKVVQSAEEEMQALNGPSLQNPADSTMGNFNPAQTVVVRQNELSKLGEIAIQPSEAKGSIELTSYDPMKLVYNSNNTQDGIAVFSEIYYPLDWEAKIDGQTVPIARVNYVLRGIKIPAGSHTIEMIYNKPKSYVKGEQFAMIGSIGLILLLGAGVFFTFRKQQ